MQEAVAQALNEIRSAWRFRWFGVGLAWTLCLVGWGWVAWQPDIYQAGAVVYVDMSSVLRPILNDRIVTSDVATQLNYVRQALLGREHLERVVRDNGMDAEATSLREREELMDRLRTNIRIESSQPGRNDSSVYNIAYQHPNRETAVSVVRTLLNSLVEDTLGANRQGTDTAERFLEERIQEYENRLRRAEEARADFQRRNAGRLRTDTGGYFERIEQERTELEAVERELRLAEARRDRLREQLRGDLPVMPLSFDNGEENESAIYGIDARIADYRQQLDRLLLDYTEKHPDVIGVRDVLERLEAQRDEELRKETANPQAVVSAMSTNPVYQELQIRLNEVEVEIAGLQAEVQERTTTLNELQALMNELPEVEAELARLNRDYEVVYDQYQALVRSRETQDLSRKAAATDQVDFRVINPPLAELEPIAPRRLLLLAGVFVLGLSSGGGVCWLFAQIKPVFSEARSLRELTGLPVLGTVSHVVTADGGQLERRVGLVSFAAAVSGLALLFAGIVAFDVLGPGVHSIAGG